jgi:hypothetical protein
MMNSRSKASRSSAWAALLVVGAMASVFVVGDEVAEAGRKRVVVLDFEGPKGGRFHDDLVRLLKKSHDVVSTDRWNGTAEEMNAEEPSNQNIKKVARKLKVDAVVEGKIEKRRDEFIIRLKLHSGASGEVIGSPVDTKAETAKLDGRAQRDIKDELLDVLDAQPGGSGGGGGGDLEDDKPLATRGSKAARGKKAADDEDNDKPAGRGGFSKHFESDADTDADPPVKKAKKPEKPEKPEAKADEDDKPVKIAKATRPAKVDTKADTDDDKPPAKKPAKVVAKADDDDKPRKKAKRDDDDARPARKRTAARDEDDAELEARAVREPLDQAAALSPGERAVDIDIGLEAQSRVLKFQIRTGLMQIPNNYASNPNPGMQFDATIYPLAIGHTSDSQLKNIGINVFGERAFHVTSKVNNVDNPKTYHSFDSRFGFGAVYRYALGRSPTAPVFLGSLVYSGQQFSITSDSGRNTSGVPNVRYKMVEPGVGVRYPFTAKIIGLVDGKVMAMLDTGQIQGTKQYGTSKIVGFEGMVGVDYLWKPNLFIRAAFHAETIGFTFQGNGAMGERDNDPTTKDVLGARDTYLGGMATVGYAY